jgi:hypothetical protein
MQARTTGVIDEESISGRTVGDGIYHLRPGGSVLGSTGFEYQQVCCRNGEAQRSYNKACRSVAVRNFMGGGKRYENSRRLRGGVGRAHTFTFRVQFW